MCYLAVLIYPFTLSTQCLKEQFLLIVKFTLHTVHTAVQVEHGYNYVVTSLEIQNVTIEHWFSLILYACMYVHMPVCINVCTCIHGCIYMCMCVCMHVCVDLHVHMYASVYVCIYVYV